MRLPDGYGPGLFFSDEGRLGRKGFWLYALTALGFAVLVLLAVGPRRMALAHTLFGIAMIFPSYCVFSKRFQDLDIPGVWAVVSVSITAVDLVMGITGLASRPGFPATIARVWMHLSNANLIIVVLILGILRGSDEPNRYGHVPDL